MRYLVLGFDGKTGKVRIVWQGVDPTNAQLAATNDARYYEHGVFILRIEEADGEGWPRVNPVSAVSYQGYNAHRYGDLYEEGGWLPPFDPPDGA